MGYQIYEIRYRSGKLLGNLRGTEKNPCALPVLKCEWLTERLFFCGQFRNISQLT